MFKGTLDFPYQEIDVDDLCQKAPKTLSEYIDNTQYQGATRNIKMAALMLVGVTYLELSKQFHVSPTVARKVVLDSIEKVWATARQCSMSYLRLKRLTILQRLAQL